MPPTYKGLILLVDDHPFHLHKLLKKLTNAGYHIETHSESETVVQKAIALHPDLILLDVVMPKMNGYEVCEALLKQPQLKDTPVIFISGLTHHIDKVRAFKAGAVDFINKATHFEETLARVNTHITLHQLKRELQQKNETLKAEIEKRNQAQQSEKRLNQSVEQVLSELPVVMARLDKNDSIKWTYGGQLDWQGHAPQDFGERPAQPHLSELSKIIDRVRRGERVTHEYSINTPQGVAYFQAYAIPAPDDPQGVIVFTIDISERRRLAEAYRSVVENSLQGLVIQQDKQIVFANQTIAKMLGYSLKEMYNFSLADWVKSVHPDQLAKMNTLVKKYLQGDFRVNRYDLHLIRKDGTPIWLEHFVSPIEYQGKPALQISYVDVTERKRFENALKTSEARLRAVWETAADAMALSDKNGIVLQANLAYLEFYNLTEEAVINQPFYIIFPKNFHQQALAEYRAVFHQNDPPPVFKTTLPRKEGGLRHVETRTSFIEENGKRVAMLSIIRDVTQRQEYEDELEASKSLLDEAQRIARLGGWVYKIQSRDVIWTRQTYTLLEVPPNYQPSLTEALKFYPGDARKKFAQALERASTLGESFDLHLPLITATEKSLWVRIIGHPVYDEADNIVRVQGVLQDITQQKQMEERLQQSQKMEVIGQLAGGVAHHFNNMLTAIMGYINFALHELDATHKVYQDLQNVHHIVKRASQLTHQLLAFARQQDIKPQTVNINHLIVEMEPLLSQLLSQKITFEKDLAEELDWVNIDSSQFEQLLVNLMVNAKDAMPQGGVLGLKTEKITLKKALNTPEVDIPPGEYIVLHVTDSGQGISEAVRRHIFEPFFTTKEVGKGTGLGLPTCFGIVKQHKGYITASNRAEGGAVFRVYLPPAQSQAGRRNAPRPSATLSQGQECILLVEPDVTVRRLMKRTLSNQGYTVLDTANNTEVLTLFEKIEQSQAIPLPDLLISNVDETQPQGNTITQMLKARHPALKIILIANYNTAQDLLKGISQSDANLLTKPFDPSTLLQVVRHTLDGLAQT